MKFSILIPAFKKQYFKECLKSIITQTYSDFEIIVVDDNSPENLKAVINELNNDKIKYYRNKNNIGAINVVDNWNICLKYASGDFCICMGDDDILSDNCLMEYYNSINKYPLIDVFHARTILIDHNSKPLYITKLRPEHESCLDHIRQRMDGELQYVGDFCYRTKKLKDLGGYIKMPLAWGADDVTSYMMSKDQGIVNIDIPSFFYRVNTLSISSSGNVKIKINAYQKHKIWLNKFLSTYDGQDLSMESLLNLKYIKENLDSYFSKKIEGDIGKDMKSHKLHIFYWLLYKEKYKISYKTLFKGILRAFE